MGELRVSISGEAHAKLKILATIHGKKLDEVVEMLIMNAEVPKPNYLKFKHG